MNNKMMIKLVKAEAASLVKRATDKEKSNLSFEQLNTNRHDSCIYGQMTGSCFSDRAENLITASCKRVYSHVGDGSRVRGRLNGEPKNRNVYWSPIEVFIDKDYNKANGNNERLIAYIKGETKTLKLK